jgi:hypothetical protein
MSTLQWAWQAPHHCVSAAPVDLNHSSMVKASLAINILAVLPLASNASSAGCAEMIDPAIMARTASKYFRITDQHRSKDFVPA